MKKENHTLCRELRFWGGIYKRLLPGGRLAGKGIPVKRRFRESPRNIALLREDGTRLRLYCMRSRRQGGDAVGILWIHGGGFYTGFPETARFFMPHHMLRRANCVILAPDYRLSTEAPYPAALEDCYAALLWMKDHGAELGIRPDKLFVGGESAGGGLTAALCLYARDRGEAAIACQMPLYPMLDDRMDTPSMQGNDAPVWNEAKNREAWRLYLSGLESVPKYAAPARETDYRGLPPAISFVGGAEPFRDETVEYMENLKAAGVPVDFRLYDGCFHSFDCMVPLSRPARAAREFFLRTFQKACREYSAPQP